MTFETEIIIASIGAFGSSLAVILGYFFTKKTEIKADLRQNKMKRYDDLVHSLTELIRTHATPEATQEFINAYYSVGGYASRSVLDACFKLLSSLEKLEDKPLPSINYIFAEVENIYNAIRKDTLDQTEANYPFRAYHVRPSGRVSP